MTVALVTGVTGQDGTYLSERLVAEGVEVHGLVQRDDVPSDLLPPAVRLHVGDLREPGRLAEVVRQVSPDEIYNLGGISSVAYSWEHPVETGAVTGLGAAALFDAAWHLQEDTGKAVRVLQASSAEIFGTPMRSPQDEQTPIRPASPYGAAKAYAHQMAAAYRARGLAVSACVLYNHESPRRPPSFVTRKITSAAARIAREGRGTLALGNLDARRDWGWAPDYVDAMVRAVRHPSADEYVVATGSTHTVAEFVSTAFASAGIDEWEAYVTVDPRFVRPADPAEQVGDPRKANEVLGWQHTVGFHEIVARMVRHDQELLTG